MHDSEPAARLVEVFERIHRKRMQGLPVVSQILEVEAVGFTQWRGRQLGVLIAPWFMNLILLPGEGDDWRGLRKGARQHWELPAGELEFFVAEVAGITYQSCALFTSVLDFKDQATARAVALEVMRQILNPGEAGFRAHGRPTELSTVSRRELLRRYLG